MKKSTKRFCLKLATGILSTTLVASVVLPLNVLATTVKSLDIISENMVVDSITDNYSENIIREIEEERDEFSKTFLMTDGTYYTYVSPVAIHEFIEDKWVDIDDSLSEIPATISEAEEIVKEYVEETENTSSQISTFALPNVSTSISVTCIGNASQTETGYSLPSDGALIIKPTTITNFSENNRVLLSATLNVSIASNTFNSDIALDLKSVDMDLASISLEEIINGKNIYYNEYKNNTTDYSFDITDSYSKWERGINENNGVALVSPNVIFFPLELTAKPILSFTYKDVAANDSSFTYHTLDLGRAGILTINDLTNAFKIEQTIAGLDCSLLPVTLTRTIESSKFSLDSYANVSSEWNYNYSLSIAGTHATITLPQGTKIEFKQPANAEIIDHYQIWEQDTNEDYVDDIVLHVKDTALTSNSLSGCYFEINGIEYYSNMLGRIDTIKKANKELKIKYDYFDDLDQFVITKLTDANGNQYKISYSTYTINEVNYIFANKIAVEDSDDNDVMFDETPLEINVENTVANSIITSTYTYPSTNEQPIMVSYNYDLDGKLLSIVSADGTTTQLNYKDSDNNYLVGYTQTKDNNVINELVISSENTFERVFESTITEKEIQRYDKNFQLTTHYYGDNVVSMTYEDGLISSYATNNSSYTETQNKFKNGDFSYPPIGNGWMKILQSDISHDSINGKLIIKNNSIGTTAGVRQGITGLSVDKTYIFYAETEVIESLPCNDYPFKVYIDFYENANTIAKTVELPFDVTLVGETQVRMAAFKLDNSYPAVSVTIATIGNTGEYHVDNVRLYEATEEDGSIAIPGVSISDPIATTITDGGQIKREIITDGTNYMLQEYDYTSDGAKAIGVNDFNGVSSYFDYSGRAEILSEKGYALDSRNFIVDPINYDYNGAGLLQYVTQTINTVTGDELDVLTEYTYDSLDRVISVSNNDYCYNFTYDDIGNITNINKEDISSETPVTSNLVDYTYDNNNIGTITYSNGYKLEYSYNETGKITSIICFKLIDGNYTSVGSYTYTYTNGHLSETLIDLNDLSYDIKISNTDTGIEIYHTQNEISTLVYSKSKTTLNSVEKYISSASGSNLLETFTKTNVTETVVGNNTELYSEFYGSKYSSVSMDTTRLDFSGSNNTVKDYFGRVSSKYFTLESDIINIETSENVQNDELSLTHNYSYVTLDSEFSDGLIRTSNLINSVGNIISAERIEDGVTTTEELEMYYNYIYDNRGNIRFIYLHNTGEGEYYLEKYYQYDEANQITAELGNNGLIFYLYDSNGNIVEKSFGGEINVTGIIPELLENLSCITEEVWNTVDWSIFDDMRFSPAKPEKKVLYGYDDLDRFTEYVEKNYTYDSEGEAIETIVVNMQIPYDEYGNPLKYIGESTTLDKTITADLIWNGNQLESAIIYDGSTKNQKLSFKYDENGYRINKTTYSYDAANDSFVEAQHTNYIWENGNLKGMQLSYVEDGIHAYMYTNVLYDNTGVPYAITTPTGLAYYFLRDASNNVKGLISSNGELATYMNYDAFGNITMDVASGDLGTAIINTLSAMYNPCTYKGYLYDYELGMYFVQNKCYSPKFGRFLNETALESLTEPKDNPLDINLHRFCNNNPVNSFDINAEWDRDKFSFTSDQTHGIQVKMSNSFLSRPFCTLYASKILSESGSWDYLNGRNIKNMGIERIASNLFARCVGNYAESAVNRVNATWGDGWIVSNRNSDTIIITESDSNADKYMKIWLAAPSIKSFATAHGIYITL